MSPVCIHCGHKQRKPRASDRLITASSSRCFRACPRKYLLRYVKGLRPRTTARALRFGTLVHDGLAAWWQGKQWTPGDADPFDLARAQAMLSAYDARWNMDGFEVVAIEHPFSVPLVRGWRLAGKVDGIVRRNGRVWLIEHKTSSADIGIGSDYLTRLSLDTQVSLYHLGMHAVGYEIAGCIYDVLKKAPIKPLLATPEEKRKFVKETGALYANQRDHDETPNEYQIRVLEEIAEDPNAYFVRAEVVRIDGELEEARADIVSTVRAIDQCTKSGAWSRNDDSCFTYGIRCGYWALCTKTGNESDFDVAEDKHPELSNA